VEPMLQLALELSQFQQHQLVGFPAATGKSVLVKICSAYTDFETCAQKVPCESESVRAIEASYGFMCKEAYEKFLKHASCFAKVSLTKMVVFNSKAF